MTFIPAGEARLDLYTDAMLLDIGPDTFVVPLARLADLTATRRSAAVPSLSSASPPGSVQLQDAPPRELFDASYARARKQFPTRLLCRMTISGGTDANSYDLVLNVVTTEGRTLQGVVRVEVKD
jgi:hypothetical protein